MQILIASLAGAVTTAILISAVRVRRHRARLVAMGRRHGMGLIQGAASRAALESARRFARREQKAQLRDVLVGQDEEGRFHFARRSIARRSHHVLFAINASESHVEAFHVAPLPARSQRRSRWQLGGPRVERGSDWELELQWSSPRSFWLGGQTLGVAARTLSLLARASSEKGAIPMGMEIHARYVAIHSDRALGGRELDRFVDDAIRLRRQILQVVHAVDAKSGERPSLTGPRRTLVETDERVTVLS